MSAHFEIPIWANGPDGSGNGGYSAGCIAEACGLHDGAVEVNLRLPPPLATPLTATWSDEDDAWRVLDPDRALVASATRSNLADLAIPPGIRDVTPQLARDASTRFPYRDGHPFPRCLCCGTERAADVPSLEIHCGSVAGTALHADTWTPLADLADPTDPSVVSRAACFSALDCPSASPFADPARPSVLARYEVELTAQARVGEQYVLVAWEIARDGRKLTSASAIVNGDGSIIGIARALWIEVRTA